MNEPPEESHPHEFARIAHAGAPIEDARFAVILLHGRGASAADILTLAHHLERPGVAFLAPQAARSAWYPDSFLAPFAANEPELSSAHELLTTILTSLAERGLPAKHVALVGFSQGGCLAVDHAARSPRRYGFVAALTGGLIGPPGTAFEFTGSLDGSPVFLGANDPDAHVPWERVAASAEVLRDMGGDVRLERYAGYPHAVNADEIRRLGELLDEVLATGFD